MPIHPSAHNYVLTFGKYKGLTFGHVAQHHRWHLDWMIGANGVPMDWKEAAAKVLQGLSIDGMGLPSHIIDPNTLKNEMFAINVERGIVGCRFPFDAAKVDPFKLAVDGGNFDKGRECWTFPKEQLLHAVEFFGGTKNVAPDAQIKEWYHDEKIRRATLDEIRVKGDVDIDIPGILFPLRPYQKVAIQFGEAAGDRWFCADDVGLGKTPISIGWALRRGGRTIVTANKTLLAQWVAQIKKFTGLTACVWDGTGALGDIGAAFHVINWDVIAKNVDKLNRVGFDNLIVDEATKIKNYQSTRAKAIMGYYRDRDNFPGLDIPNVVLLSATPVLNNVMEYFTLLRFLDKKRFNDPSRFKQKYKDGDPKNQLELYERAKTLVIRRLQAEVAPEIPKKSRDELIVEMDSKEQVAYERHLNALFKKWGKTGRADATQMPAIRKFLFDLKFPRIIEFIDEIIESRPIIIFGVQQEHVERIAKHYGPNVAAYIHGRVSEKKREQAKQDFITGKIKVLCLTILTGGMGLDGLQYVCRDALIAELWWTPGDHEQAEGRLPRIGQEHPVTIWYMKVKETHDEDMALILDEKLAIIERSVNGREMGEHDVAKLRTKSIFAEVVKRMAARRGAMLAEPEIDVEDVAA